MPIDENQTFLVGIAGGSGSGKTTFLRKILERIPENLRSEVGSIHQDSYYLTVPPEQFKIHGQPNFDHPGAFDWDLFRNHLRDIAQGLKIDVPVYDFKKDRRKDETKSIGPCKAVLVEGIFTLWDAEIRNILGLKIYLSVEADIRFIRRLHRDVSERGRTIDSVIKQYYDSVRPMYREFLDPTKQFADFIVGEETDKAADVIAARVCAALVENTESPSQGE